MLAISNSEMRSFQWCKRNWYLAYFLGYSMRPEVDRPVGDAKLGTRIHTALELWYGRGLDPLRAIAVIYELARVQYRDNDSDIDRLDKEHDLALAMVEGYLDWVEETGIDEGITVISVEEELIIPSGVPGVNFRAKLDQRVIREHDGASMFLDHKPQPVSEPVLTASGWRKMGDIKPGDAVICADGTHSEVLRVFDRGVDDVFTVTFNDGTTVRATADHPWLMRSHLNGKHHIVETRDLRPGYRPRRFEPYRDVDRVMDIGVDLYVLGFWLGNGDRSLRGVCDGEEETVRECERRNAIKAISRDTRGTGVWYGSFNRETKEALRAIGCDGLYSSQRTINDHVPAGFFTGSSWNQRLDLLHGLMDSDGFMTMNNSVKYGTTSEKLADDVAELARSLGAWARVWRCDRPNWVGTKESGYATKTFGYLVTIRSSFNPFKRNKYHARFNEHKAAVSGRRGTNSTDKIVVSVEASGRDEVRCIEIASSDHLYVTSGWTVTHNTVGSFENSTVLLHMDSQMRFYSMLEMLKAVRDGGGVNTPRTDGGLWNMLRRSKRTSTAKPPFYRRDDVRFNVHELRSMWLKSNSIVGAISSTRRALEAGADHRSEVPPNPSRDCVWRCIFVKICPLMDDGSNYQGALDGNYVIQDPYAYYERDTAPVIAQLTT